MNTTDTPETKPARPTESTNDAAPRPPEDDGTVLPAIQETSRTAHSAAIDTVSQEFDREKFLEEFSSLLHRIDNERNPSTTAESLIPELEKLLIPAMEAGIYPQQLKYFALNIFRKNALARNRVLTAINKAGIDAYLRSAVKAGFIEEDSLLLYGNFITRLLRADRDRWIASDRHTDSRTAETLYKELERAVSSGDMDPGMIIRIAEIVFSDYAFVIPTTVERLVGTRVRVRQARS